MRVDEGEDRQVKLLRQLHDPQRLAEPFGARLPEVAHDLLFGVAPLLMADHAGRLPAKAGEAGHDRGVVRELAVAVNLRPLVE